MAVVTSKYLYVKVIDPSGALNGNGIFAGVPYSALSVYYGKSEDSLKLITISFGLINKFKNYGELVVSMNNALRAINLQNSVVAQQGATFTATDPDSGRKVSGLMIVLTAKTGLFSMTDGRGNSFGVKWHIPQGTIVPPSSSAVSSFYVGEQYVPPTEDEKDAQKFGKIHKHIVLPLTYVSNSTETDKTVDEVPRTAVIESMEKTQRTAVNVSLQLHFNPEGTLDASGTIQPEYERYIMNRLVGVSQKFLHAPEAAVYVTHTLRRVDVATLAPGRIRFIKDQLEHYLEDTEQSLNKFKIGLVVDTMYTVHTAYLEMEAITDPDYITVEDMDEETVEYPYILARVKLGTTPVVEQGIVLHMAAFYPIQVVYSTVNLQFKYQNDGALVYTFSATVDPEENKRAIL